ncbi:hypothetical protein D3C87_2043090 [compost metagenome]
MEAKSEQARRRAAGHHAILPDQGRAAGEQRQPPFEGDAELSGIGVGIQRQQVVGGIQRDRG